MRRPLMRIVIFGGVLDGVIEGEGEVRTMEMYESTNLAMKR
jgi:hypothetical protein